MLWGARQRHGSLGGSAQRGGGGGREGGWCAQSELVLSLEAMSCSCCFHCISMWFWIQWDASWFIATNSQSSEAAIAGNLRVKKGWTQNFVTMLRRFCLENKYPHPQICCILGDQMSKSPFKSPLCSWISFASKWGASHQEGCVASGLSSRLINLADNHSKFKPHCLA